MAIFDNKEEKTKTVYNHVENIKKSNDLIVKTKQVVFDCLETLPDSSILDPELLESLGKVMSIELDHSLI